MKSPDRLASTNFARMLIVATRNFRRRQQAAGSMPREGEFEKLMHVEPGWREHSWPQDNEIIRACGVRLSGPSASGSAHENGPSRGP